MNQHFKLCISIVLAIVCTFLLTPQENNLISLNELRPYQKYTNSYTMDTGETYRLNFYKGNSIIKNCDVNINFDTIEFLDGFEKEVVSFTDFDYRTISIQSPDKTSSMVVFVASENNGTLNFILEGTVPKDIIGKYHLIYEDENRESDLEWDITGKAVEYNCIENGKRTKDRNMLACITYSDNDEAGIGFYCNKEWEFYDFKVFENTIRLTKKQEVL